MVVTFCGSSHIDVLEKHRIEKSLDYNIRKVISAGAKEFLLPPPEEGDFGRMCAYLLMDLKKKWPDLKLIMVIPYLKEYDTRGFDETIYPPIADIPLRMAEEKRDEYMVDRANVVIHYTDSSDEKAEKMRLYACSKWKFTERVIAERGDYITT